MANSVSGWHRVPGTHQRHETRPSLIASWEHDNGARIFQGWETRGAARQVFVYLLVLPLGAEREHRLLGNAKAEGAGVQV